MSTYEEKLENLRLAAAALAEDGVSDVRSFLEGTRRAAPLFASQYLGQRQPEHGENEVLDRASHVAITRLNGDLVVFARLPST